MSVFDSVRQLKEKVWSEKGVPVNRQVIWIDDRAISNEGQKLCDLGVAVGDIDDGLGGGGGENEGKDVIGLQVLKEAKSEPAAAPSNAANAHSSSTTAGSPGEADEPGSGNLTVKPEVKETKPLIFKVKPPY